VTGIISIYKTEYEGILSLGEGKEWKALKIKGHLEINPVPISLSSRLSF